MATPPPGSIPLPGGGWITPEQQRQGAMGIVKDPNEPGYAIPRIPSFEEWVNSSSDPEAVRIRKAMASGEMKASTFNSFKKNYEKTAERMRLDLERGAIDDVVKASTLDPSEIDQYEVGEDISYDDAIGALYDPSQIKRDTTGRDYQTGALDYLGGVMASGRDAASDAYYEGQRADAEQAARAQREAGMQNLEEQGRASGGGALLNELMAARDVGTNANRAALESSALMQARKDKAASEMGTLGGNVQGADDDWLSWYTDKQTDYGHDVSGIKQSEAATNWERRNKVNDINTGMVNEATVSNKSLPAWAYGQYGRTSGAASGSSTSGVGPTTDQHQYGGIREAGALLDTGAKIYELGWGDDDDDEDED